MKKLVTLVLVLSLGLFTFGCGSSTPAAKKPTPPSAPAADKGTPKAPGGEKAPEGAKAPEGEKAPAKEAAK